MMSPVARPNSLSWSGLLLLLIACLALGATTGCRVDAAQPDDTIHIDLVAPLFPPPAGDGRLALRLSDENDQPIDTAALHIRGDMTHAGMLPIEASAAGGDGGVYRVPVRWTMAGDWIITVEATLNDGRRASRSFDMVVTGEEEVCTDGQ
jgi:hypothetical protein